MLTMEEAIDLTNISKTGQSAITEFYEKYKGIGDEAQRSPYAINLVTCILSFHFAGIASLQTPIEDVLQHAFAIGVIIGIAMEREELTDGHLNPPA